MTKAKLQNIRFNSDGNFICTADYESPEDQPVGSNVAEMAAMLIHEDMGLESLRVDLVEQWIDGAYDMLFDFNATVMLEESLDYYTIAAPDIDKMGFWFTMAPASFKTYRDKYLPGVPVSSIFAALALEAADGITTRAASGFADVQAAGIAGKAIAYAVSFSNLDVELGTRKETGRKGGLARAAKYDKTKAHALRKANAGRYPSRRQAVLGIKDDVLEFMRNEGIPPLSPYQADKTLDGWLKAAGYTPSGR